MGDFFSENDERIEFWWEFLGYIKSPQILKMDCWDLNCSRSRHRLWWMLIWAMAGQPTDSWTSEIFFWQRHSSTCFQTNRYQLLEITTREIFEPDTAGKWQWIELLMWFKNQEARYPQQNTYNYTRHYVSCVRPGKDDLHRQSGLSWFPGGAGGVGRLNSLVMEGSAYLGCSYLPRPL